MEYINRLRYKGAIPTLGTSNGLVNNAVYDNMGIIGDPEPPTPTPTPTGTTYSVIQTAGGYGVVVPNPDRPLVSGDSVSLSVIPDTGYEFVNMIVSMGEFSATATTLPYVIDNVTNDIYVTINCEIPSPTTGTTYRLVTDVNELSIGDKVIFAGLNGETWYSVGKQNNNNRSTTEVTNTNNTITLDPATEQGYDGVVYEFILGQENNNWTFYDTVYEGYLYRAGVDTQNHLRTQTQNDSNGQWNITIGQDNSANIASQSTELSSKLLSFRSAQVFSCSNSSVFPVYIFKAD